MKDFNVLTCDATVTQAKMVDGRMVVKLDATCFHPRGGGQDWDTGTMRGDDGMEVAVIEVRNDDDGGVSHVVEPADDRLAPDVRVLCEVDAERRRINSRIHSAGHLVDVALLRLGIDWKPGKAAHYTHMSFVEYAGDYDPDEATELRTRIENKLAELVEHGGKNTLQFVSVEDLPKYCHYVPDNLPDRGEYIRVVTYCGDFGIPCGGTHVSELSQIGKITLTKMKRKDGQIRISYKLDL